MPLIYLSPSTQELNFYITGGTEEEYMNALADQMVPFLDASGIQYQRNTPDMTALSSIRASNAGNYDLHFALHSNAHDAGKGQVRGSIAFYYPSSYYGRRFAEIVAENLREIYPLPDRVSAQSTTDIGEVKRTRAPSVLLELAFHDNIEDANWISNNMQEIAMNLVESICQYFGIPFLMPAPAKTGQIQVSSGWLNIRKQPNLSADVLARGSDGSPVKIINTWNDWYLVNYNGIIGYAKSEYIDVI